MSKDNETWDAMMRAFSEEKINQEIKKAQPDYTNLINQITGTEILIWIKSFLLGLWWMIGFGILNISFDYWGSYFLSIGILHWLWAVKIFWQTKSSA